MERDIDSIEYDLESGLITPEGAKRFGAVVNKDGISVDREATAELRASAANPNKTAALFNFGGSIEEIISRCEAETGLPPPAPPVFLTRNVQAEERG